MGGYMEIIGVITLIIGVYMGIIGVIKGLHVIMEKKMETCI